MEYLAVVRNRHAVALPCDLAAAHTICWQRKIFHNGIRKLDLFIQRQPDRLGRILYLIPPQAFLIVVTQCGKCHGADICFIYGAFTEYALICCSADLQGNIWRPCLRRPGPFVPPCYISCVPGYPARVILHLCS